MNIETTFYCECTWIDPRLFEISSRIIVLGEGDEECRTIVGAIVVLVGASTIVILGEVN